jgi:4-hydroxybenzoate polyprenyltransferase
MTTRVGTASNPVLVPPLLRAAHFGPCVAVTTVTALLAVGQDLSAYRAVVVTAAVFTGQLTIGWGNDLVDAARDREVGRSDKPLANDELRPSTVRACLLVAALACVALSLAVGWRSAVVHLGLGVACGHLYNLLLKSSIWSWAPYAVAFGTLPAVVTLADVPHHWPPLWMMGAAAALGIAAHFFNVLPDLAADATTGVRGLPHRVGAARGRVLAITLLVGASVVAALGPEGAPDARAWAALTLVAVLAVVATLGHGRTPFQAAMLIALVDVVLITVVAT